MKFQIRRCNQCHNYTMNQKCVKCDCETESVHPAKYSPDDKYSRYRLAERYQN